MKKSHLLLIFCIAILSVACNNTDEPVGPPAGDNYVGSQRCITLGAVAQDFYGTEYECIIKSEDGTIFSRTGRHERHGSSSVLTFDTGLRSGVYRLLALRVPSDNDTPGDGYDEYGLGCRVSISTDDNSAVVLDTYDSNIRMTGAGTAENPYIISSPDHLWRLRDFVNDDESNRLITKDTHFRQECNLAMRDVCLASDRKYGWLSIGAQPENPFRGVYDGGGYKVMGLFAKRPNSPGVGLFGFVENAELKNIEIVNPDIEGNFAVGSLVGGTTSPGDDRAITTLHGCKTIGGSVIASDGSAGIGGLVGIVNRYGVLVADSCFNRGTAVAGDYGVGGIVGAGGIYSMTYVQNCKNSGDVTGQYTGAGGMVGSVDSLMVMACENSGFIVGGIKAGTGNLDKGGYGTGGIAGGTGVSQIYTSLNTGDVIGAVGVGGIIGSTRIGNDEAEYADEHGNPTLFLNSTLVKSCGNTGNIAGLTAVGGISGESQFGGYALYNTGIVRATDTEAKVAGIVGNSSIAVIHNAINQGTVNATNADAAGGIAGLSTWGAFFACQNYGSIDVNSKYAGGICGWAGNYTVANMCMNMGSVSNSGGISTGGIVGEAGDAREWTGKDIANCIIGGMECALGIFGPALSVAGNALTSETMKFARQFEHFFHVLHVGETALDYSLMAADRVMFAISTYDMIAKEEIKSMESALELENTRIDSEVRATMQGLRANYNIPGNAITRGLNYEPVKNAFSNFDAVVDFYQASDDNNSVINYNINRVREERYEQEEHKKKVKEIVHKTIAGACIAAAGCAAVVSGFATAGTTTAIAAGLFGSFVSIVGGANAVIESVTNFRVNTIVLSQCANLGTVKSDKSKYVGGIAGRLQDNCIASDCINFGKYDGDISENHRTSGSIVGSAESDVDIHRCLSLGSHWYSPIAVFYGISSSHEYCHHYNGCEYTYVTGSREHDAHTLGLKSTYYNWDFNGNIPKWSLDEGDGNYPIPYHSEMERPIE